ncbi:MAG: heavy-metal-associated domain-containing protein [Anaerolineae bacterium]|nr:heavy-metal-associated domain-containing protein [Anaerolineae bacterium]
MTELIITGMDCANCAANLEKNLGKLPGVQAVSVSFATGKMQINSSLDGAALQQAIEKLGYGVAQGRRPPRNPAACCAVGGALCWRRSSGACCWWGRWPCWPRC